jgi:16S rRNA (guanine527-N7)-methyltransferase
MDRHNLIEIILKYFPEITAEQESQFTMLYPVYKEWNEKINVISRNDIENIYERHVLHSLSILKFFSFQPGTTFLDVGTGGGFPGIPLAIMLPDCRFTLIDSIGKKILVVNEVIKSLGIKNVTAKKENVLNLKIRYNFVLSRAVTSLPEFHNMTSKNILKDGNGGIIYLKGGEFSEELNEINAMNEVYHISDVFKEEFFETKKLVFIKG